jgi:hypothetical protein
LFGKSTAIKQKMKKMVFYLFIYLFICIGSEEEPSQQQENEISEGLQYQSSDSEDDAIVYFIIHLFFFVFFRFFLVLLFLFHSFSVLFHQTNKQTNIQKSTKSITAKEMEIYNREQSKTKMKYLYSNAIKRNPELEKLFPLLAREEFNPLFVFDLFSKIRNEDVCLFIFVSVCLFILLMLVYLCYLFMCFSFLCYACLFLVVFVLFMFVLFMCFVYLLFLPSFHFSWKC